MLSDSEIIAFLTQVKTSLNNNNYQILDQRRKYMSTLAQLGIVTQDVINDIQGLTKDENWKREPDNNPSFPGDVWICKKILHNERIYIKLKIKTSSSGTLLVMSYHIDGM